MRRRFAASTRSTPACRIPGIPTLVVIGKDGLIAKIEVGLPDADGKDLREAIEAALAKWRHPFGPGVQTVGPK